MPKLYATVELPDGRKVLGKCHTFTQCDGTFLDPDTIECEWIETGADLTADELNEEISETHYLHEYVLEHGKFEE
jgi:hypothetical protein